MPSACFCLGARHAIVTNCLACGYIVCASDCPDPEQHDNIICSLCSTACVRPCTEKQARSSGFDEDAVRAYAMKDRLLNFDREHAQRTKVLDAQNDYYTAGTWHTEEERQRLLERESKKVEGISRFRTGRKVDIILDSDKSPRVVDAEEANCAEEDNEDIQGEPSKSGTILGITRCLPLLDFDGEQRETQQGLGQESYQNDDASVGAEMLSLQNRELHQQQFSRAGDTYRFIQMRLFKQHLKETAGAQVV